MMKILAPDLFMLSVVVLALNIIFFTVYDSIEFVNQDVFIRSNVELIKNIEHAVELFKYFNTDALKV